MLRRTILLLVLLGAASGIWLLPAAENGKKNIDNEDLSYIARVRGLSRMLGGVEDTETVEKRQQMIMDLAYLLRESERLNKDKKTKPFETFIEPRLRIMSLHTRYDAVDVLKRAPNLFETEPAMYESLARIFINMNDSEKISVGLQSETRLEESYDQRSLAGEALLSLYKHVYHKQTDRYKEEMFGKARRDILRLLHREALTVPTRIWLQQNDQNNFQRCECSSVLMVMSRQLKEQPADFWEKWWKNAQVELDTDVFFRTHIIRLLGETAQTESIPVLEAILDHETSPFPRKAALASLARLAPAQAVPILARATTDADVSVCIEALRLLEGLLQGESGWHVSSDIRYAIRNAFLAKTNLNKEQIQAILNFQKIDDVKPFVVSSIIEGEFMKTLLPLELSQADRDKLVQQLEAGENPNIVVSAEQVKKVREELSSPDMKKLIYRAIDNENQGVRVVALSFLQVWKHGKDPELLAILKKRLETPHTTPDNPLVIRGEQSADARFNAVDVAEIYDAKELIPELLRMAELEKDQRICNRAALAVHHLGGGLQAAKYVIPQLLDRDSRSWVIKRAAFTLSDMSGKMLGFEDARNPENYSELVANASAEERKKIAKLWEKLANE